jgi:diguanylate cyclase
LAAVGIAQQRRWTVGLLLAALASLALSLLTWQSARLERGRAIDFAVVVALAALAQLAAVGIRMGGVRMRLGWGEAAVIIALYLLPSGWVPLAICLGVALARLVDPLLGNRRPFLAGVENVALLTVTASAASAVACAIRDPFSATMSLQPISALIAAAIVYYVVGALLISVPTAARAQMRYRSVARGALTAKGYMAVGNITVGMVVVAVLSARMAWFVVLTPLLWVLRVTYRSQLAVVADRTSWRLFTESQQQLSQADEASVAQAGSRGLVRVLGAASVHIRVAEPGEEQRRYEHGTPAGDEPVRQPLLVGGEQVGELEITRVEPLDGREQAQFAVFAGALAVALHDAQGQAQLRTLAAQASHDAAHDPLTGIGNRPGFLLGGEQLLADLSPDARIALILLDVNGFKRVNETLGHSGGDDLLRMMARRLRSTADPTEPVARLGGDEFALLAVVPPKRAGTPDDALGYAVDRARGLAGLLTNPISAAGSAVVVEVSCGVAVTRAGECAVPELLRRADIALSQARRVGTTVAFYDAGLETASTDRLLLLAELREALATDDQLVLLLQPVVALDSGALLSMEALVRWNHPRRGELAPEEFMPVVEQSELVGGFTRYVLDRALSIAGNWRSEGHPIPISVNLSPRNLLDPNLPNEVARLLTFHRVPGELLTLEITETVKMPDFPMVLGVLAELRLLGVRLSVDDFGTGFSSLTFITRVPVDEVKVDRTFVAQMADSPAAAAIVRATLDIASDMRLRVVAEGVETVEQRDRLVSLGCAAGQGFHFFRPMPPDRLRSVLDSVPGAEVIPLRADEAS